MFFITMVVVTAFVSVGGLLVVGIKQQEEIRLLEWMAMYHDNEVQKALAEIKRLEEKVSELSK